MNARYDHGIQYNVYGENRYAYTLWCTPHPVECYAVKSLCDLINTLRVRVEALSGFGDRPLVWRGGTVTINTRSQTDYYSCLV